MFAGAAREAVFSNAKVIERIKADFIPVALKAGRVNNPPDNLEGRLYRDIARSKPAPQGICVVNSDGKVLSWSLMFDDDQSVLGFLDHCLKRYKEFPTAKKRFAAQRFMKFPSKKLADVADSGNVIEIPKGAKCRIDPPLQRGTLVGRVIGRALDKNGKPIADTRKQEHYLEARFHVPVGVQERFAKAFAAAGEKRFQVPNELARTLVSNAYLGQLDVNPLGGRRIGGKTDRDQMQFWAQTVPAKEKGITRIHITGNSNVAGGQGGGQRTDGRRWEHEVKLEWEGYIDLKKNRITRLMAVARGIEKLRWGNKFWNTTGQDAVSFLPAGHPINLNCEVRYGLLATPANEADVGDVPPAKKSIDLPQARWEQTLVGMFGSRFIALQEKVWKDLKLSKKQTEKLRSIRESEFRNLAKLMARLEGAAPQQRPQIIQPHREQAHERLGAQLQSLLNAAQQKRLQQLAIQRQGLFVLADPAIAKRIKLSDKQRTKMTAIIQEMRQRFQALQKKALAVGDPRWIQKHALKIRREQEAKIEKLLTDEQRARWRDMIGKRILCCKRRDRYIQLTTDPVWF